MGVNETGTAPVDVLAVMDAAIQAARARLKDAETEGTGAASAFRCSQLERLLQARAAIAELIESMPSLLALYRIKWGNLDADANAVYERAEAALANVSGGGS